MLILSAAFKEWNSVVCFFGGSTNALVALHCARHLSYLSATTLRIFTQSQNTNESYEAGLRDASVFDSVESAAEQWLYFAEGDLTDNFYAIQPSQLPLSDSRAPPTSFILTLA